ncbi:MAG TPA: SDR family oxidoreductase [Novosphingobium sp.]|nr:SDR family oxidoreductase [Novosphingobium sp.]
MGLGLQSKVAIVTGGSKGIGREIALELAREGASVVVAARGREAVEACVADIAAAGGTALGAVADMAVPGAAETLVGQAVERFGKVDILVCNSGGQRTRAGFDELTDEDFIEAYTDNVLSVVRLVRAALPGMRERRWGRIITIVSEVSTQPDRTFQHYAAAKAAELNLTKSLSKTLARDGILVNAVAPGLIATPGIEESFARGAREQGRPIEAVKADFMRKFKPGLVLARAGEAQEVAAAVAFLASERASYITGANLRVDGGSVIGIN